GSKREVFGMTIPNELINDVIRGAVYYDTYLEKVAQNQIAYEHRIAYEALQGSIHRDEDEDFDDDKAQVETKKKGKQDSPLGGDPGHVTIQPDFFFNKDLEYLRY
ncbi:hypothetical protein Tco_0544423, partial [Tanacetum coccineum]